MKRTIMFVAVALLCAVFFIGCAPVMTPTAGAIYTNVNWPQGETSNAGSAKVGMGECVSILSLIATGDCSIQTAAKNAGISRIHHVDYNTTSILGIFGKLTVKVYGE